MKPLLTKKQVSELLNIPVKTIDYMVSKQSIPFIKLGRLVRFNPDVLNGWVEKRTIKTRA